MKTLLLGNIISLVGALIMVGLGLVKKKEHVVIGQCIQCLILGVGNTILGGYIGMINNLVTITRNLVSLKKDFNLRFKLIFCAIPIVITFFVNTEGPIGWLPVAATCAFTWILDAKGDSMVKIAVIFGQICWLFYDIHYINISAAVFDVLCVITNIIGLWMIRKGLRTSAEQ